ncbi:MAG: beta-carotene hydroxylase [Granulosicoccus sp.]|jgi:beta-carotene hydroxylase
MLQPKHTFSLPNKEQYFRELKQTPAMSWPALGLLLLGLSVIGGASSMALSGTSPMWVATIANGIGLYFLFSIMHESLHRSLSRNKNVNEILGRFSLLLLIPAAPLEIARWAHFQHHRFTSTDQDPDRFIHDAKWWQVLFRWPNFDLYYLYSFLRKGGDQRKRHARALIFQAAFFVAVVATLVYFGYGMELFFLWILASRIALALVALVFVFLPHHPANITSAESEHQATSIRQGWEWLLTPLFVFQNYHLIHHLYPTAPFYNYIKIWHLKYDEITAQKPAIQKGFGLLPVNIDSTKVDTAA